MPTQTPAVLTIAGSDSGGGAGIQADLRTFAALGAFGTSAITCLTAQNLNGVTGVSPAEPAFVRAQMDAVFDGFSVRAVKTGMLFSRAIVDCVAEGLASHSAQNVVVDPVMVATSGARLLEEDAVRAYLERLIPLATVVTPNIDELHVLTGRRCETSAQAIEAGRALFDRYRVPVLVKGGHLAGPAHDHLVSASGVLEYTGPRIEGVHTHGSGCTYAAAIAAALAHGNDLPEAVAVAKQFLAAAFANPVQLDAGATDSGRGRRVLHAGLGKMRETVVAHRGATS